MRKEVFQKVKSGEALVDGPRRQPTLQLTTGKVLGEGEGAQQKDELCNIQHCFQVQKQL